MSNLRWVERTDKVGYWVLQEDINRDVGHGPVWADVPQAKGDPKNGLCADCGRQLFRSDEPKKVKNVECELAVYLIGERDKNMSFGSGFYEREVAKSVIKFFKNRLKANNVENSRLKLILFGEWV